MRIYLVELANKAFKQNDPLATEREGIEWLSIELHLVDYRGDD